ncbi:uncharacterized protein LOC124158860 [Ischnura elegans]|uniref:uncharacterized protein LOC124158860 n=1 Tax=Ischnura elegans TaxID=197161 RepID=UPI001ED86C65|nr:uncharacterized protein LOC124158860 [Ischnura elegans]
MEDEDIGRFRSSFARSMVDADRSSVTGDDEFGGALLSSVGDDLCTEMTSLGSRTSWSESWSPLPAASPPPHSSSPSCTTPPPHPGPRLMALHSDPSTLLRVQVESLNWKISQMDVGYKMQRVVLQEVLSFLERLPSDLSSNPSESTWRNSSQTCSKCGNVVQSSTRRNSLELSPRNVNFSDTPVNGLPYTIRPGSSFDHSPLRDIPWRRRRRDSSSSAERFGSEAQRLLRTIRSVLAATTPEPNLLGASRGENNSISGRSESLNTSQQTDLSVPQALCGNPVRNGAAASSGLSESEEEAFRLVSEGGQRLWEGQRAWGGRQKAIRSRGGCPKPQMQAMSTSSSSSSSKSYDSQCTGNSGGGKGCLIVECRGDPSQRLPEEEESGFSSLGSLAQDGGKGVVARGSFHEVGLPVDCQGEALTVLWV